MFFLKQLRINSVAYIDILGRNRRPTFFQQDSALSHYPKFVVSKLSNVWDVVERDVNSHPHNTKDFLKTSIVRIMDIDKDCLICTCERFRSQVKVVMEAEENFIEESY